MSSIKSLKWRYATKKFDEKKTVSKKKLKRLEKAFNLTATSYGLQPIKLIVIQDKSLQERLVEHSMNQPQVAQASHVLVFCIETGLNGEYIAEYFDRVRKIRKTPDHILKPFEDYLTEDFNARSEDDLELWSTKQAYLAMGNLLTICALEKIDACPMEGFNPEKYDEVLDLKERGLKSVLVLPIGYRAEDDIQASFKKVRKNLEEVVIRL